MGYASKGKINSVQSIVIDQPMDSLVIDCINYSRSVSGKIKSKILQCEKPNVVVVF